MSKSSHLKAGSLGELVCLPDDDELQHDAHHQATDHEAEALNPRILEEFGHDGMRAMTSISTPALLGNAPAWTVARAGR